MILLGRAGRGGSPVILPFFYSCNDIAIGCSGCEASELAESLARTFGLP